MAKITLNLTLDEAELLLGAVALAAKKHQGKSLKHKPEVRMLVDLGRKISAPVGAPFGARVEDPDGWFDRTLTQVMQPPVNKTPRY